MKGKLDSFLEVDVDLELVQIDSDWPVFRSFRHFFHPLKTLEKTGDLIRAEDDPKKPDGPNRTETYQMPQLISIFGEP